MKLISPSDPLDFETVDEFLNKPIQALIYSQLFQIYFEYFPTDNFMHFIDNKQFKPRIHHII